MPSCGMTFASPAAGMPSVISLTEEPSPSERMPSTTIFSPSLTPLSSWVTLSTVLPVVTSRRVTVCPSGFIT